MSEVREGAKAAARLLLACAAAEPDDAEISGRLVTADIATVVDAAIHHRIAPLVHIRLRDATGLSDPSLTEEHQSQLFRHLRILAGLRWLDDVFADVPWLAFKGPVLAAVYERPDLRSYSDLDVLVDRHRLNDVVSALEAQGATLVDRNWTMIRRDVRGEMSWLLPGGVPLDLHWTLINDRQIRSEFSLPVEAMLQRRAPMEVGSKPIPTFDAVDMLLYVALHGVYSGGHRLMWTVDIDRIVRKLRPDWSDVVDRARTAGLSVLVAVALERSRRLMGTDVPVQVLGQLAPTLGWRGLLALSDRVRGPELSFRPGPTGRIFAESTRGTTLTSLAASRRQLKRWRRRRSGGLEPGGDLFADAGDPTDRDAFLRLLAEPVSP